MGTGDSNPRERANMGITVRALANLALGEWLTEKGGVATIPVSAFYKVPVENQVVRFCFAKKEETLDKAITKLSKFS